MLTEMACLELLGQKMVMPPQIREKLTLKKKECILVLYPFTHDILYEKNNL